MDPRIRVGALAALAWLGGADALSQTVQPPAASTAAQQFGVTGFDVGGNTLLPQLLVDATLAPYKGERSLDELQQAAAALQDAYRRAGYGAVVVYLPEQPLGSGPLKITVLEGRLARVVVLGNQQFSTANVRRSLPALREGETPRVQRIDAQVQLANDNPARRLAVTLEEGQQQGEVDARITVIEEPVSRWSLTADNTGNAQTGRLRVGLGWQHAALWDLDHQFSAQLQVAPEHVHDVQIFNASYRVPLYAAGVVLQAYGTYSSVDAGSTATAAGALQFNGKGRVFGVLATRLFERLGEFEQRASVSLDKRDYLNDCSIQDLPPGACGSAGESVTVHPLTLEYAASRGGDSPAGGNASVSYNLGLGGHHGGDGSFESVRAGADRHYAVLRAAAYAGIPLGSDWRVNLRAAGQWTPDALVSGEQFGLAGAYVVRGYEEREVSGDVGVAATVEVLTPLLLAPAQRSGTLWDGMRLVAFADAGSVRNRHDLSCDNEHTRCHLASLGLGVRFNLWASVWKLDVARAMRDARDTDRGDIRLHFQASLAF